MKIHHDLTGDGDSDLAGQAARREARVRTRMASITHKFAVVSSKGGVGKSAVTANLAVALAMQGHKVGILDADINRPRVARMLGIPDQTFMLGVGGIVPKLGPFGIKVVSINLRRPRDAAPATWKAATLRNRRTWLGTVEATALQEFLTDTLWGELDFLLIDLSPGRGRYPALRELLPECDGAFVATQPSRAAAPAVTRSIGQAKRARPLRMIEYMTGYWCERQGVLHHFFRAKQAQRHRRSACQCWGKYLSTLALPAGASEGRPS